VRLQAENWSTPPPDRKAKHGVEEGRSQWRYRGRLVQQGLKGGSIKIVEDDTVTVMIDERSKIN
jgi:hypothetical protein